MSMWTRQEVLSAHATMNGKPPPDAVVVDEMAVNKADAAFDMATAAFAVAVAALSIAMYVYLTRSN